ncbi:MAG: cytochrome C oxidase subunit IV family protein [SAR202 cluster bacterium]|jgi:cytochrome c oxidase subunit 4|nr:cytochrome C oxidase subunit IV family protein [SAR202 cluster bacterium]MDP6300322.1 cytochrome C oxidase subunit IV family protein [SAR202 cluster bacterium]MDP7103096.1 cytochrome C oxidase subunit IV family protein [SAR202 cluster bacterium]MDP7224539.1 cytochrome C oxidase subunit IV family protein [SAR202 cluster bacterium]MDP7413879.1 cytochrome C oxidase subunit IV family protein [SAR202 cluster bacterium]|tara:strand:- start:4541 stop:4882 length:342 start_codon:yes stop_codon:yes gene_type:complete
MIDQSARPSQQTQEAMQSAAVHTGHPTPATYFKVAMTLVAITGVEIGVFYVTSLGYGIIPVLAILSAVKFALVAMFYMHLKYDARLFSAMFVTGVVLAVTVVFALLGLFQVFV